MLPGMQSLKKDHVVETRAQMNVILNPTLGNMVEDERIFSFVETLGHVPVELPMEEVVRVASLRRITGQGHRNPVIDYLQCHSTSVKQPVNPESAILLNAKTELPTRAPASNA
ncbi:hypothetical protein HOY82DRAFT_605111 [Tuber indicum]|nr:hypothetical protein HOY82DRAFT_605111 [Tuber indicum]